MKVTLPDGSDTGLVTEVQFARIQEKRRQRLVREQELWMLEAGEIVVMHDRREPQFWWFASSVDTDTRTVDARTIVFEMPWAQTLPFSRVEKHIPADPTEVREAEACWARLKSWMPPNARCEDVPLLRKAA